MIRFLVGAATGYVLGSRAGRERYEQIVRWSHRVADNPAVQGIAGLVRAQVSRGVAQIFHNGPTPDPDQPGLSAVRDRRGTAPSPASTRSGSHCCAPLDPGSRVEPDLRHRPVPTGHPADHTQPAATREHRGASS